MRVCQSAIVIVSAGLLGSSAGVAAAETEVRAGDLDDATWTAAGSPYVLAGDVRIPVGVTLVVEAGTVVEAGAAAGSSVAIEVGGVLRVEGTAAAPARLIGAPAGGGWDGIVVEDTAVVRLDHAVLVDPEIGVLIRGGEVASTALTVERAGTAGVYVTGGSPTFDRLVTRGARHGVVVAGARATLRNCVIRGAADGEHGISIMAADQPGPPRDVVVNVIHCTIVGNGGHGVLVRTSEGADMTVHVVNSIVSRNGRHGVMRASPAGGAATINVEHSDVWGNALGDLTEVAAGPGSFSADPRLDDGLGLAAGSPCIDTATFAALDHDAAGRVRPIDADGAPGAVADVGAYERVPAPSQCGNGAWEPGEACDSGVMNGEYGACDATCSAFGPHCGDGAVDGPETCDDGNARGGDGCSAMCTREDIEEVDGGPGEAIDAGVDPAGDAGNGASGDAGMIGDEIPTGCCSTSRGAGAARDTGILALLAGLVALRRRRASREPPRD